MDLALYFIYRRNSEQTAICSEDLLASSWITVAACCATYRHYESHPRS
jgi:hypothetical protein